MKIDLGKPFYNYERDEYFSMPGDFLTLFSFYVDRTLKRKTLEEFRDMRNTILHTQFNIKQGVSDETEIQIY